MLLGRYYEELGRSLKELRRSFEELGRDSDGLDKPWDYLISSTQFLYWTILSELYGMSKKSKRSAVRYVINPALEQGLITREHPENTHHPHQRYLLTAKGIEVLEAINKELSRDGHE